MPAPSEEIRGKCDVEGENTLSKYVLSSSAKFLRVNNRVVIRVHAFEGVTVSQYYYNCRRGNCF